MSTGTIDSDAPNLSLTPPPLPVHVYSYVPGDPEPFTLIPRLHCVRIDNKEGREPPNAQFIYEQDDSNPDQDDDIPTQFEDYWPGSAKKFDYLVRTGDRIVVLATVDHKESEEQGYEDVTRVLFDGYMQIPQTDVDRSSQSSTFMAVGVAIRAWDKPIQKILMQDADQPETGEVHEIDAACRFNPDGKPNCCTTPYQDDQYGDQEFYVFMDQNFTRDADKIGPWTIDRAVISLLAQHNGKDSLIDNPDFDVLEALLRNRRPIDGISFFDPSDSLTYVESPIALRDLDVTGESWPDAVERILAYGGFGMRFVCEDDENGEPWNYLEVYRKDFDGPTEPKELNLPRTGSQTTDVVDVSSINLSHDFHGVANEIHIETKLMRIETAVVLAPGFEIFATDSTPEHKKRYLKSEIEKTGDYHDSYRLYIADECGDGHWLMDDVTWSVDPLDLSKLFPNDQKGNRTYSRRYRPGSAELFSLNQNGTAIKSQLAFSRDYSGEAPSVWDGSGTWQTVNGGFQILKDRLGIWISVSDPASWSIGDAADSATAQEPTKVLDAVTCQAFSATGATPSNQRSKKLYFRLTTTIETDRDIDVVAEKRLASPVGHVIRRLIDCKDHFTRQAVAPSSPHYDGDGEENTYVIDQESEAKAHAYQLRSVQEFPLVAGSFVIPYISFAYDIGDRIAKINGRAVGLESNVGRNNGESPFYPFIVAKTYQFNPDIQSTTLQISDRRMEPQRVR